MENNSQIGYYLGSSTPQGFTSFFGDSYEADWRAVIIKGGPGSGKSTLMKRIAQKAEELGERCERIFCSSDPSSLDAVIIPGLKRAIFDGTAPHVLEPKMPGACESIISTGVIWRVSELEEERRRLSALSDECARLHALAKKYLLCSGALFSPAEEIIKKHLDKGALSRLALSMTAGLGASHAPSEEKRLLTAVTPKGVNTLTGTFDAYGCDLYPIPDLTGLASGTLLSLIRDRLLELGESFITCYSPLSGLPEHIILPEKATAFCSVESSGGELLSSSLTELESAVISQALEEREGMLEKACAALESALSVHDDLEAVYAAHSDFDKLKPLFAQAEELLFG